MNFAVDASSGLLEVSNTGVISAGFSGVSVDVDASLNLVNSGEITVLDSLAVVGGDLSDKVKNSGSILGNLELDDGGNLLINSGEILGDVITGGGGRHDPDHRVRRDLGRGPVGWRQRRHHRRVER